MKILRLDLLAFGAFSDRRLDLSAGTEGLHLIYGPNEAGKSTALRALRQLLYGIPVQSSDNFVHNYRDMRIGAALRGHDGVVLECVRRKRNKDPLVRPDDSPIDESEMRTLLGGVDQPTFETMFGIDHDTLVKGGDAIVNGNGDLGRILFAAGASIADLRGIQNGLQEEADALFLPNGKKPAINNTLAELDKTRKLMRDQELPSADWSRHDETLQAATTRKQEIDEKLDDLLRQKSRLERIRDALPVIASRLTKLDRLRECVDATLLPENFGEQRREAQAALNHAREAERQAREARDDIERELGKLQAGLADPLLTHSDAVKAMQERLGSHKKALLDRGQLESELRQHEVNARELLRALRPDCELDQAEQLRLPQPERLRIQQFGAQQPALVHATEVAANLANIQTKIEVVCWQLRELEAERDPAALQQSIRRALQAGPIQQQGDDLRATVARDESQLEAERAALPLWSGNLEELERLQVPGAEIIDRCDREHAELERIVEELQRQQAEFAAEELELLRKIEEFERDQSVPAESDLGQARMNRDMLWQQSRQAWLEGRPDAGLADNFEQAMRATDDIADRLRSQAAQVAAKAQLHTDCARAGERHNQAKDQLRDAEAKRAAALEQWVSLWQPAGIAPQPPRDMRTWQRQWAELCTRIRQLREQRGRLAALDEAVRSHREELEKCLADLGIPAADSPDLSTLIERGQQVADRLAKLSTERGRLTTELAQRTEELPAAEAATQTAQANLEQWRQSWTEATQRLGLGANPEPGEVAAFLERTNALFATLDLAGSHRGRIAGIDADTVEFTRDLRTLAEKLAPDVVMLSLESIVGELQAGLEAARTAKEKSDALLVQRERETRKLQAAQSAGAEAAGRLEGLRRDAGCADLDGLARAEERSLQRRRLETEVRDLEQQILQRSAGTPLDAFLAEAHAIDPDSLAAQLQHLEQDVARIQKEKEGLDQAIGAEQALLAQMDGSARAAESAEQVQALLAQLAADAEQYSRLKLAAVVLREGIERYRKKNQDPVLQRAGQLFAQLTRGSFAGLRVEVDDHGETVLVGVRPDGKITAVEAMSEGTRDQLYLALRLASLETFLQRNGPMPFIVDDVLIQFDDDRSKAVLKVLAEFSRKTQVIFFTHHEHLVRMAEGSLPVDSLFVHRL
jgi:uncharacterized protein YhaN